MAYLNSSRLSVFHTEGSAERKRTSQPRAGRRLTRRPISLGNEKVAFFLAQRIGADSDLKSGRRNLFASPRIPLLGIEERFMPESRAAVILPCLHDHDGPAPRRVKLKGRIGSRWQVDFLAVERISLPKMDVDRRTVIARDCLRCSVSNTARTLSCESRQNSMGRSIFFDVKT